MQEDPRRAPGNVTYSCCRPSLARPWPHSQAWLLAVGTQTRVASLQLCCLQGAQFSCRTSPERKHLLGTSGMGCPRCSGADWAFPPLLSPETEGVLPASKGG